MSKNATLKKRSEAFSEKLRGEYCAAPEARDVLSAESELGTSAIAFQLKPQGKRLLFRALDLERKAKLRRSKSEG